MGKIKPLYTTDGKRCWNCKHYSAGFCKKWTIPKPNSKPCTKYKKGRKDF